MSNPDNAGKINCLTCNSDISDNTYFYTVAKNAYMFGFFCRHDCAAMSEINQYLKAFVVKISATPSSHKALVVTPDAKVLKQYQEEAEKRKLWKKYF